MLTCLQIKDDNGKIKRYIYNRKDIEEKLIQYNQQHYKKVHKSKAYIDKINKKLIENETRDKILQDSLKAEDFDYSEVLNFLQLLKQSRPQAY